MFSALVYICINREHRETDSINSVQSSPESHGYQFIGFIVIRSKISKDGWRGGGAEDIVSFAIT